MTTLGTTSTTQQEQPKKLTPTFGKEDLPTFAAKHHTNHQRSKTPLITTTYTHNTTAPLFTIDTLKQFKEEVT